MHLDYSIIIVGQISCGKSTLAKGISHHLDIPIASFGGYLAAYARKNGLSTDRDSLQNIGQMMIDTSVDDFLHNVIASSSYMRGKLIFEGVRHHAILKAIEKISGAHTSIYIDATEEQRISRYISRDGGKDVEQLKAEFKKASLHPVEKEVPELKKQCGFVLTSSDSVDVDVKNTLDYLRQVSHANNSK